MDLCGEKSENSPRIAIRPTVLIRPLQFRYVRVPLDCIAKLCIRKDNIASLTCLMTYSHELQLYAGIHSPTEPKTTLYIDLHVGLVVVIGPTEQHQQTA